MKNLLCHLSQSETWEYFAIIAMGLIAFLNVIVGTQKQKSRTMKFSA